MTEIKNRIILDDQMSAALEAIAENTRDVMDALWGIPEVTNEIIGHFKLAEEQVLKLYEANADCFEHVNEKTVEMLESFKEAKESMAKMIEKIEDKSEALEGISKSVDKVGKSTRGASKGIEEMTLGVTKIAQSFGLIPPQVVQGISGVAQLGRGIAATIPKASSLAAMLGPVTLIATAVMKISNAFSMFRQDTEDDVLPTFNELIIRSDRLNEESERLTQNLYDNIEQMKLFAEFGASDELLERFEAFNVQTERWIGLNKLAAHWYSGEAMSTAYADMTRLFDGIVGRIEQINNEMSFQIEGLYDTMAGIFSTPISMDEWLEMGFRYAAERDPVFRDELFNLFRLHGNEIEIATSLMRESSTLAYRELAETIDMLADLTLYHNRHTLNAISSVSDLCREYREITEAITEYNETIDMSAQHIERAQRHIIRSYRDTYAVAESLRDTHYALSHAINGTSSEYMSQLEIFNNIMNMSPQYLHFLFDEYGALRDVEHAVYETTQAQIELLMLRQKNAFLDTIATWDDESETLVAFTGVVDNLTESYKDLFEWRIAALAAHEDVSEAQMAQIQNIMEMLTNFGAGASREAREGDLVRPDTINTAAGRAMVVTDPANWAIRDEIVRLKEDVTTRQFASGIYQQRGPVQIPQIQLPSINVYATPGMNEEQLARRVAKYCASYVADEIIDAYSNDLLIACR